MPKASRPLETLTEIQPSVFTDPVTVADAFKQGRRMGLTTEAFERISGASTSKLRRGRGGVEYVMKDGIEGLRRCEKVFTRAVALCGGDEKAAIGWATAAAPALKGKPPLEAAETVEGLTAVEKLFAQLEKALKRA